MNTEYLYLGAEQLYLNASGHPMSNRNWLAAIYKSLLVAKLFGKGMISTADAIY